MKRKLLSIAAVVMVCLCSMFMFAGCGLESSEAKNARYGVLNCSVSEVSITLTAAQRDQISKGQLHYHDLLSSITFTYTAPTEEGYKKEKVYDPTTKTWVLKDIPSISNATGLKAMVEKGMSISGWSSAPTEAGKTRNLTFRYRNAKVTIPYTVTHSA